MYGVGGAQLQLITACSFTGVFHGFPWWLRWQRICQQCRRPGFDPWVGKIHLEEKVAAHSKYSCLENSMNSGAWRVTVHGVAKNWTQLSDFHSPCLSYIHTFIHASLHVCNFIVIFVFLILFYSAFFHLSAGPSRQQHHQLCMH